MIKKTAGYNSEDGAIRIIMTGGARDRTELQEHVFDLTLTLGKA